MVGRHQKHKFARLTPIGLAKCLIRMAMTIRERTAESNSESEEEEWIEEAKAADSPARVALHRVWHMGNVSLRSSSTARTGGALRPCIRLAARATELPARQEP